MPKKILMVAYTNYLTDARPRREAETLVHRGDDVAFICLAEKGRPSKEVVNGVRVHRVSFSRYRGDSSIQYIAQYLKFFFWCFFLVTEYFFVHRYNIIYVHTMPDFMVFVSVIPKIFGAKVILNVHDMMPELYMSKFDLNERALLIRLLKLQERLSCLFADKIVCVHHPHCEVLVARGIESEKTTILMNVPDPIVFAKRNANGNMLPKKLTMVYHGTIAYRLGLDLAVDAFCIVLRSFPAARFEIYGDGDASEHLEAKIRILNAKENVFFSHRFFKVEEIPSLIAGATVGIIPNRKDLATEYMLPVKLLEYVYLDIPVIVPTLSTIQYYFTKQMVEYYEPGNVEQLAEAIIRLFSNKQQRDEYILHARKFTETYSWDTMKHDLFSMIDQ